MKMAALVFTGFCTFFLFAQVCANASAMPNSQTDSIPDQSQITEQIRVRTNEMITMAGQIRNELGKLSESKTGTAGILRQLSQLEQKKPKLSESETKELENLNRQRMEAEKQVRLVEQSLAAMVVNKDATLKEINKLQQQLAKMAKQKVQQSNDSGIVLQYSRIRYLLLNNALLRMEMTDAEKQILAYYDNRYAADSSFRLLVNKTVAQFRQQPAKSIESVEETQRVIEEGKAEFRRLFKLIVAHYEKQAR